MREGKGHLHVVGEVEADEEAAVAVALGVQQHAACLILEPTTTNHHHIQHNVGQPSRKASGSTAD